MLPPSHVQWLRALNYAHIHILVIYARNIIGFSSILLTSELVNLGHVLNRHSILFILLVYFRLIIIIFFQIQVLASLSIIAYVDLVRRCLLQLHLHLALIQL